MSGGVFAGPFSSGYYSDTAIAPGEYVSGGPAANAPPKGWPAYLLAMGVLSKAGTIGISIVTDAVITGTPVVGVATAYTSASVSGVPTPTLSGIQWTLDGSNILGATASTYTPVGGDTGHDLAVKETWTNIVGSVTSTSPVVTVIAGSSGSLPISWQLPTTFADGSPIGTITNQTVYYDTTSKMGTGMPYANSQSVGSGSATTFTIAGLTAAVTYYYSLTATVGGVESDLGLESSGVAV